MKGFPLLIEVFEKEIEGIFNTEYVELGRYHNTLGYYVVKDFSDFPSDNYVFKIIEYNYNSEKYGVFHK